MKIVKKIIFLSLLTFFAETGTGAAHPFYVSICQINYNTQNRALEISVKIFADDLMAALEQRNVKDLHLGEPQENSETDKYIFSYLKDKLQIATEEKTLDYFFLGKEMEDDAVWCYLETDEVNTFNKIEVTNTILTELFDTQNNIVQVTSKGKTKNLLLKKGNTSGSLNF
ncbi:hypothetical protein GM418_03075 [Maribellus comscasis]|uniref:Peptidase E n=1 Tax=Maribellus comscasis TaxID=2681766 RepID=A0A6I6JNW1_9BACT|nr:DUF6702 family protein [Maribellus comscasis]QGY42670.1 hypothetical protein GM418_03075 [Maribellus comscasis]